LYGDEEERKLLEKELDGKGERKYIARNNDANI